MNAQDLRNSCNYFADSPTPKANHVMKFNAKGFPMSRAKSFEYGKPQKAKTQTNSNKML